MANSPTPAGRGAGLSYAIGTEKRLGGLRTNVDSAAAASPTILTAAALPRFMLHGFQPPRRTVPSVDTRNDTYDPTQILKIAESMPTITAGDANPFGVTVKETQEPPGNLDATQVDRIAAFKDVQDHLKAGRAEDKEFYEALMNSDIAADVDLGRFVTNVTWESLTEPPYSVASVTLNMPSSLAHYLFHGRLSQVSIEELKNRGQTQPGEKIYVTDGFRHIEAGGWCSIQDEGGALFFGKITSITSRIVMDQRTGVPVSTFEMNCTNFLYPYMMGEHAKAVEIKEGLTKIDPAAMEGVGQVGAGNGVWKSPTMSALETYLKNPQTKASTLLSFFMREFGHFHLPPSLVGTDDRFKKLGVNLRILDGSAKSSINTIYSLASSDIDSIDHVFVRPEPQYLARAFMANSQKIWDMISSIFRPDPSMIELFPVLIPIPKVANNEAHSAVQSEPLQNLTLDVLDPVTLSDGTVEVGATLFDTVSPLAKALQAVPALVYRFKPMPPDFEISSNHLGNGGRFSQPVIPPTKPYAEQYFGVRDLTRDLKMAAKGYEYVTILDDYVLSQNLIWTDNVRVNAIHLAAPYENAEMADKLVFGVSSVPVFNTIDINRNGLRLRTGKTPFYRFATAAQKDPKLMIAASAHVERLYYTIGEGQSYANGQIECTYTLSKSLVAGVWAKIVYKDTRSARARLREGLASQRPQVVGPRDLTFYITGISHVLSIDPATGKPSGRTILTVERATYGNRIPAVDLMQVSNAAIPVTPANSPARKKTRPTNSKRTPPVTTTPSKVKPVPKAPAVNPNPVKFTPTDPTVPSAGAKVPPAAAVQAAAQTPTPTPTTSRTVPPPSYRSWAGDARAAGYEESFAQQLRYSNRWRLFDPNQFDDPARAEYGDDGVTRYYLGHNPSQSLVFYDRVKALDHPRRNKFSIYDQSTTTDATKYPAVAYNYEYITDTGELRTGVNRAGALLRSNEINNSSAGRGWIAAWDLTRNLYRIHWQDGSFSIVSPVLRYDGNSGFAQPVEADPSSGVYEVVDLVRGGGLLNYAWELLWFQEPGVAVGGEYEFSRQTIWGTETPR